MIVCGVSLFVVCVSMFGYLVSFCISDVVCVFVSCDRLVFGSCVMLML